MIKSNYYSFCLAPHSNWLSLYCPVRNTASLVFVYECSESGFNSGMLTIVRSLNNHPYIMICLIISNMQHQDSLYIWPGRKRAFFSSTFINPCFRYLPIVNIENLDFKNPRFSNICLVNIKKWEFEKDGCLKISDVLKSKFSIFTIGEYQKQGFIEVGETKIRDI